MRVDANTRALLLEYFLYDEGKLYWKKSPAIRVRAGDIAGADNGRGYLAVRLKGRTWKVHHIVWLLHRDTAPTQLDHINRCKSDNRIENLRACTTVENKRNGGPYNQRRYKGVYLEKGKWLAAIRVDGVLKRLGLFAGEREAALAYNAAAAQAHGEFARLNLLLS